MPRRHPLGLLTIAAVGAVLVLTGCAADREDGTARPLSSQAELLADPDTIAQFSGTGESLETTVTAGEVSRTLGRQADGDGGLTVTVGCAGGSSATVSVDGAEIGAGPCSGDGVDETFTVSTSERGVDLTGDHRVTIDFDEVATATITVGLIDDEEPTAPRTEAGFDANASADADGSSSGD
ncbi:hypothetical protein [Mycetocola reblochoni]|uniref:hypothetical protein n=1 Tax=Mycetocola reblochoni TaxID=331618 RepID=UPI00117C414D|nr:hypothetical protein [Mycetocola reblochoni]